MSTCASLAAGGCRVPARHVFRARADSTPTGELAHCTVCQLHLVASLGQPHCAGRGRQPSFSSRDTQTRRFLPPTPGPFVTLCLCLHVCVCLQRLADAFDLLTDDPPDLSGLHVLICGRTALDSQGTLCLDAAADAEDWAAFLGGVDTEYARDKKENAAALRQLEGRVAAGIGVRMLFTAAPYLMTHEYRHASRQMR